MLRPLSVNIAALYCPMESAPFYCFKFLFAQLNSDIESRLPYYRNNTNISIQTNTSNNGNAYFEASRATDGRRFQLIFSFESKQITAAFYDGSSWHTKELAVWS